MNKAEFPPLPEPAGSVPEDCLDHEDHSTAEQMRAYAAGAVAVERERLAAHFDSGREDDILRPGFVAKWIRGA